MKNNRADLNSTIVVEKPDNVDLTGYTVYIPMYNCNYQTIMAFYLFGIENSDTYMFPKIEKRQWATFEIDGAKIKKQ